MCMYRGHPQDCDCDRHRNRSRQRHGGGHGGGHDGGHEFQPRVAPRRDQSAGRAPLPHRRVRSQTPRGRGSPAPAPTGPPPPPVFRIERRDLTPKEINRAHTQIHNLLSQQIPEYAFVGGNALTVLGHDRPTQDLDVLVPTKDFEHAQELLLSDRFYFGRSETGKIYWFSQPADGRRPAVGHLVDLIMPHGFGKRMVGPTMTVRGAGGARFPEWWRFLEFKMFAYKKADRAPDKKLKDRSDIRFIVKTMADLSITTDTNHVRHADENTIHQMRMTYEDEGKYWDRIGLWPWRDASRPISSNSERSRESGRQGQPGPSGTRRTPPPPQQHQQYPAYGNQGGPGPSSSSYYGGGGASVAAPRPPPPQEINYAAYDDDHRGYDDRAYYSGGEEQRYDNRRRDDRERRPRGRGRDRGEDYYR
ncbi:hypothetical protein B0H66DRAFT_636565 [Apodospora peruviana]|uniref:Uncharacterized protein n=1 Tax=Apodospora peruviana TaxID=516989 RepID=A0AAE0IIP3_9PEZI|nr:hypothetical protein B0H66DRAFT_636565 [Apodospora peruviana]